MKDSHSSRSDAIHIYRRRREPGMILDMVRHGFKLGRLDLVDLQIADGGGAAFRREYVSLTVIAEAEQRNTVELMRRDVCAFWTRWIGLGINPLSDAEEFGGTSALCVNSWRNLSLMEHQTSALWGTR